MSHDIPRSRLEKWARKKYLEECTTIDLIASVADIGDKNAIAIVTLLDVEPRFRYAGMQADEKQYVESCHAYLASLGMAWETETDPPTKLDL